MLPGWLRRNGVPYSQNAVDHRVLHAVHASARPATGSSSRPSSTIRSTWRSRSSRARTSRRSRTTRSGTRRPARARRAEASASADLSLIRSRAYVAGKRIVKSTIRSFDLAHLAHVELLTPKPDESLHFFVNVMGMTESGRRGDSVYLRGWDDYEHHTLKLTASKVAGMGHFAFRATSPEALQRRVGDHREGRVRQGLDRRRPRARAGLRVQDARRPQHGDLLRDRVVQGAARAEAVAQEPGDAVSGARRQRPPARSPQPADRPMCRRCSVHRGRARHAHDRDDRARQRRGGRRAG